MTEIDPGMLAIMREQARLAADEAMSRHMNNCRVSDLANEVWGRPGNGGGLKGKVQQLLDAQQASNGWRNALAEVLKGVAILIIGAVLTWGMGLYAEHARPQQQNQSQAK